jgi:hypothetical protein
MSRYYISAQYEIGTLSYSSGQLPDGTYRTFIEANNEQDAIAAFKEYANKRVNPFISDAKPLTLLITSDEHPMPKIVNY